MPDDLAPLRISPFSDAINEFEQLISQTRRSFLIGAGCSKCAGLPLTTELTECVVKGTKGKTKEMLGELIGEFEGAADASVEEYMSEVVDRIAIATRRLDRGATNVETVIGRKKYSIKDLSTSLDEIKLAVADSIHREDFKIEVHWNFVRAVHRTLQTGRSIDSPPVDYFVLNYDTLIEDALALERLPYCDGIRGGSIGWWDPSVFTARHEAGFAARVLKLHGSIDWCLFKGEVVPRRLRKSLTPCAGIPFENLLIWPAATKYRETERDPFAQIGQQFREALRPGAQSYVVLAICGYRFGDAHINAKLDQALRESQKRLTLLVFTEVASLGGIVKEWHESPELRDQVRIYSRRGFFHLTDTPSTVDLPWWKFEVITRLLGGER